MKNELILKKTEKFEPSNYHIGLSLNIEKGMEPVAYFDYDPVRKTIKGLNPYLGKKVIFFLQRTQNIHLIEKIKQSF